MRRRLIVLDAPTNLGLRPPMPGSVPGCYKAPWALREAGLFRGWPHVELDGVVVPPRYESKWDPGDGDRNADAIASYSRRVADRLHPWLGGHTVPLVLGGDCSVLIGEMLALRRRGRSGLVFVDGHSDFRHPDNGVIGAAAGEDLAIVLGRGDPRLTGLEGLGPYAQSRDVCVVGIREDDDHATELVSLGVDTWPVDRLRDRGIGRAATAIRDLVEAPALVGFWVHVDVDVLDPAAMPAVDTSTPGGLTPDELSVSLHCLLESPKLAGFDLCIFDPDRDPGGEHARTLVQIVHESIPDVLSGADA